MKRTSPKSYRLEVAAPADHVWACLVDPARVACCVPGAQLGTCEDGSLDGVIRLKVGPVPVVAAVTMRVTPLEQGRTAVVEATGTNRRTGRAVSTRWSLSVSATADGSTRCDISGELQAEPALDERESSQAHTLIERLIPQFCRALEQQADGREIAEQGSLPAPEPEGPAPDPPAGRAAAHPSAAVALAGAVAALLVGWAFTSRARASRGPASVPRTCVRGRGVAGTWWAGRRGSSSVTPAGRAPRPQRIERSS
jgi:carbon monoxide dehydrogenase subunit G